MPGELFFPDLWRTTGRCWYLDLSLFPAQQQNIQKFEQTAAQDLQKKQQDMMGPLIEKARAAIKKVAEGQGFDYVLDASANGAVLMAKGKDLMTDVKSELGF